MEALTIQENKGQRQFETTVDGHPARIEYIRQPDKIFLTHTEVHPALEGKGIGSQLIKQVLEQVEAENLKLIPLCPFVAAYLQRHPEWQRLLAPGYGV